MVQGSKQVGGGRWLSFVCGQMALLIVGPSHLPASAQRSKLDLLQHSATRFFNAKIKGELLSKL